MGRVIRGNSRWVRALVGVPDAHSVRLANTLAMATGTASPMARGAQGWDHQGLPGTGVNERTELTGPLQHFAGVNERLAKPQAGVYGDALAGMMPGASVAGPSSSLAWMSLDSVANVGWS